MSKYLRLQLSYDNPLGIILRIASFGDYTNDITDAIKFSVYDD